MELRAASPDVRKIAISTPRFIYMRLSVFQKFWLHLFLHSPFAMAEVNLYLDSYLPLPSTPSLTYRLALIYGAVIIGLFYALGRALSWVWLEDLDYTHLSTVTKRARVRVESSFGTSIPV